MSEIKSAWEKERICYQQRYAMYAKKFANDQENKEVKGHLMECSYVLIHIFGLTPKQVNELEHNFSGLTNADLKNDR